MRKGFVAGGLVAAAMTLAACGGEAPAGGEAAYRGDDPLPNGMTVKQQIEARQHNLKDLGGANKTVGDQLKTDAPQLEQIRLAVQEIGNHSREIGNWFPAGTGPDAGVKTEAKANIWTDAAGFKAAAERFAAEASKLSDVATTDNLEAIRVQATATGLACKNCHDTYREKKKE